MIIKENLDQTLEKPEEVAALIRNILKMEHEIDRDKEHFWVIGRSSADTVKYIELVSLGGLRSATVAPRETFRLAIMKAVDSIICVHNHPSGSTDPSFEDTAITEKLKKSGEIIGIKMMDHIIITKSGYYSFLQDGRGKF